jgi:transcriptional regulator with XRE-family HTH domain
VNRSALSKATHKNGAIREEGFRRVMKRRGLRLERNRRLFHFRRCRYTPDFYDPSTGIYYEVIGSRQRFEQLLPKLDLMDICYPEVKLEVLSPTGEVFRRRVRWRGELAEAVDSALQEQGMTMSMLAEQLGVASSTLSNFLTGRINSGPLRVACDTWLRTRVAPPLRPDLVRIATARMERSALAASLRERIERGGYRKSAIARGLDVSRQDIADALTGRGSMPMLYRIAAWLDGPGANGAGHVDLRRTEHKAMAQQAAR